MGDGASAIRNVREAVDRSNCSVGSFCFSVNYRRERARTICVRRLMTWSSEPRRDVQSVAIISRSISDEYSTSPGCRESDSTICATRQPQSRWQPVCRRKLSLSNSDMPARPSRWIPMLTCFHTCRTRLPLGLRQCCLERRCDD